MYGDVNAVQPIIEFRAMGKRFFSKNKEVQALSDINLSIYPGEIFGIIGMSGAGKSTLVRCINFLERPTEGTVCFDGKDLSSLHNWELREARRSMGMIFQQFNLLMQKTAMENICFPLSIAGVKKDEARKRAGELLDLVDLGDRGEAYPAQLSGGQKQRVAIARALATNPKVLLCDEATSALDPKTTRSILRLLKDINQKLGITIVVITHEMGVIEEICHRVAIIDNSRIVEAGKVADIFIRPKSEAAKRMVYPDGRREDTFNGNRCCRVVFDGRSSFEPVIANMVLDCKEAVNIMFADTKDINGRAFGQMVLQLPREDAAADKIINYLKTKGMQVEEVNGYV